MTRCLTVGLIRAWQGSELTDRVSVCEGGV